MFGERHHALCDRVAGGLVAGNGEGDNEQPELVVGELVAVDVGFDQRSDDVVARVGCFLRGQPHGIEHQLAGGRQCLHILEFRVFVADHLVCPLKEFCAVLQRHPDEAGDGLQW